MHISDGILSWQVLAAGTAACAGGAGAGLYKLREEDIPKAALLASVFFVASLIHVPAGGASAHLMLTGLMGILLGWAVFPVFLAALLLQSVLLGHGGLTALGVNTVNMSVPGLACYYIFGRNIRMKSYRSAVVLGFGAGALGILLATFMGGTALLASGREFMPVFKGLMVLHIPVAFAEGIITAAVTGFLWKVKPEILSAFNRRSRHGL